jgi:23S rRNA pseudouridine2605 synthase
VKEIDLSPFNYSVTIHEGRKRQVRRMFERLRHTVMALRRVRIGKLNLGDLKEGEIRPLNAKEIAALLSE